MKSVFCILIVMMLTIELSPLYAINLNIKEVNIDEETKQRMKSDKQAEKSEKEESIQSTEMPTDEMLDQEEELLGATAQVSNTTNQNMVTIKIHRTNSNEYKETVWLGSVEEGKKSQFFNFLKDNSIAVWKQSDAENKVIYFYFKQKNSADIVCIRFDIPSEYFSSVNENSLSFLSDIIKIEEIFPLLTTLLQGEGSSTYQEQMDFIRNTEIDLEEISSSNNRIRFKIFRQNSEIKRSLIPEFIDQALMSSIENDRQADYYLECQEYIEDATEITSSIAGSILASIGNSLSQRAPNGDLLISETEQSFVNQSDIPQDFTLEPTAFNNSLIEVPHNGSESLVSGIETHLTFDTDNRTGLIGIIEPDMDNNFISQ